MNNRIAREACGSYWKSNWSAKFTQVAELTMYAYIADNVEWKTSVRPLNFLGPLIFMKKGGGWVGCTIYSIICLSSVALEWQPGCFAAILQL